MEANGSAPQRARDGKHVVTLREVADAAGVSTSTVSRVLDDRVPPSRSATAERVRAVADQLGYRRNTFASSLRRGQTATIGVLVPRLSDTVMALMYEAISRAATRLGYFTVVATTGDNPADESDAARTLLARNVDGLIVASSRRDDPLPRELRERGVPHALVLRTDGISPSSVGDDEAGGYLATRHLIDLGHTDIAVLSGPLFASTAVGRLAGRERRSGKRESRKCPSGSSKRRSASRTARRPGTGSSAPRPVRPPSSPPTTTSRSESWPPRTDAR